MKTRGEYLQDARVLIKAGESELSVILLVLLDIRDLLEDANRVEIVGQQMTDRDYRDLFGPKEDNQPTV